MFETYKQIEEAEELKLEKILKVADIEFTLKEMSMGDKTTVFTYENKDTLININIDNDNNTIKVVEEKINEEHITVDSDDVIPDTVSVQLTNLVNSNTIEAKVDTGADMTSLHAENIQISGNNVTFICPELTNNKIGLPVHEIQKIKTADSTKDRVVVKLNLLINNKQLDNIDVNLNDRGDMNYVMLVGKNALDAGDFLVKVDSTEDNIDNTGDSLNK